MTDTLTTALERSAQPKEAKALRDVLDLHRPHIVRLMGSESGAERFETAAMTYLRVRPALIECNPYSIIGGLRQGAQLGLELGPLDHFALIPFKREAVFVLMYRGMIHLAYASGLVKDVSTGVAHEGDAFEWREGTRPFLDHTPAGPPAEREWTHAYAVARLKTGGTVFRVIFPEDVEKAQSRSQNAKHPQSPWQTDYFAMIRKTAVRRLSPMLPQSPAFAQAIERDEAPIDAVAAQEALESGGQA